MSVTEETVSHASPDNRAALIRSLKMLAAEDMYDVLKAIIRGYDGPTVDAATAVSSHVEKARAVIAKAEGR